MVVDNNVVVGECLFRVGGQQSRVIVALVCSEIGIHVCARYAFITLHIFSLHQNKIDGVYMISRFYVQHDLRVSIRCIQIMTKF